MRYLTLITARGGSKGVPGKNIKLLAGKPLLCYTIDAARGFSDDSDICLSTDDPSIIEVASGYGLTVPFIRPAELATDTAGAYQVIRHAYQWYESRGINYDAVVLLQPTSPFRNVSHIQDAVKLYSSSIDMVTSVCEAASNPYFTLFEENEDGFLIKSKEGEFVRRQDCPKVYELNGAVYVINSASLMNYNSTSEFKRTIKFLMSDADSLDIDTKLDWEFAEFLMSKRKSDV